MKAEGKKEMKLLSLNDFLTEILEYTQESKNYQRGVLLLQEYQEFLNKEITLMSFIQLFDGYEIQDSEEWINFYGGIRVYNNCDSVHNMWGVVFVDGVPRDKSIRTIRDIVNFKDLIIKNKESVLSF